MIGLGVSPCDVSQVVNRFEVIDLLFFDQYALLLVGLCTTWFRAIRFRSLSTCFQQLRCFFHVCIFMSFFFLICNAYAEFRLLVLKYRTCSRHLIPRDFPVGPTFE